MSEAATLRARSALFARVYAVAQETTRALLKPVLRTLDELGCGARPDAAKFDQNVRKALVGFAHDPASAPQFQSLRLPATPTTRQALIEGLLYSLGSNERNSERLARLVTSMSAEAIATPAPRTVGLLDPSDPRARSVALSGQLQFFFGSAVRLSKRLREMQQTVSEPYKGTIPAGAGESFFSWSKESYVDEGVEQTAELLALFPELATGVYKKSGLQGVEDFPPVVKGTASTHSREFVDHVHAHLSNASRWELVSMVAIVAAGIALTVVTAGAFGAVAGMMAGAGLGLAQGGATVYRATSELNQAQDTHRFGAGSADRVAFLENEVQGAWGMLLVDVVTGGVLGRVGGAGTLSKVLTTARTAAVAGSGSAIGTATNPNVWSSPNTAGVLLKAAVIGGVAGGAGQAAGSWLSKAGNRVMLALSRDTGPLKPGAMVKLGAEKQSASTEGRVVAVDGDTVQVATPEGVVGYRVDDAAIVTAQYGGGGQGPKPIGPTVAAHNVARRDALIEASIKSAPNKTVIHHPKDSPFLIQHAMDNPAPDGYWGLTMHGSDDGFFYLTRKANPSGGQTTVRQYYLTDDEVVDIMRRTGYRQGTPVFLMVCNSGGGHTGREAMAARLARLLDTHVLAPEFPVAPVPSQFTGGSSNVHTVQPKAGSMRGNPDSHYMLFGPSGAELKRFSPIDLPQARGVFDVDDLGAQAQRLMQ
ncbi:MAG: hypothetical protein KUG77_15145 [Nannocystaceae bacterium]|nr:hypothetical protein [Nannocystaceae bacterium]